MGKSRRGPFVTTREWADEFNCSTVHVIDMIKQGKISGVQIGKGRRWYIPREDYIEAKKRRNDDIKKRKEERKQMNLQEIIEENNEAPHIDDLSSIEDILEPPKLIAERRNDYEYIDGDPYMRITEKSRTLTHDIRQMVNGVTGSTTDTYVVETALEFLWKSLKKKIDTDGFDRQIHLYADETTFRPRGLDRGGLEDEEKCINDKDFQSFLKDAGDPVDSRYDMDFIDIPELYKAVMCAYERFTGAHWGFKQSCAYAASVYKVDFKDVGHYVAQRYKSLHKIQYEETVCDEIQDHD